MKRYTKKGFAFLYFMLLTVFFVVGQQLEEVVLKYGETNIDNFSKESSNSYVSEEDIVVSAKVDSISNINLVSTNSVKFVEGFHAKASSNVHASIGTKPNEQIEIQPVIISSTLPDVVKNTFYIYNINVKESKLEIDIPAKTFVRQVIVYDITGKLIYEEDALKSNELFLNQEIYQSYIIKLFLNDGSSISKKILY